MVSKTEKRKEYARTYYQTHKEKWRIRNKQARIKRKALNPRAFNDEQNALAKRSRDKLRISNPQLFMWRRTKQSAKERGIEFSIKPEDIIIPAVCPILLVPLVFGIGKSSAHSPSVDRIDNSKGYSSDNIAIISNQANRNKLNMSKDDIKRLYEYVFK